MERQNVRSTQSILAEYSDLCEIKRCSKPQRQPQPRVVRDFPYTSVDGTLYVVPPKSSRKDMNVHKTRSMSGPLTRQLRRRRPNNNRRKFKPTEVDGILYVVPPKSTKKGTQTSNPRTMMSRASRSSKRCRRSNQWASTRSRLNPRSAHPANTRCQGREMQGSKLNANAAKFVPSVSLYASIVPGKTSFVTTSDGISLARVSAHFFVSTNYLNSILTQPLGVLCLNANYQSG